MWWRRSGESEISMGAAGVKPVSTPTPIPFWEEIFSRGLNRLERFFDSGIFAAFGLALLFFFVLLLLGILLLPTSQGALSGFAADFKIWCFGYNPATGKIDLGYLSSFLGVPLMLGAGLWMLWGEQVRALWRHERRRLLSPVAVALLLALAAGASLLFLYKPAKAGSAAAVFPAKALRTAYQPPPLQLVNQERRRISLARMRPNVVMITAVYSTCGYACPMILAQIKRVIAALSAQERKELRVLALTLDPRRDTPEQLAKMAKAHAVSAPFFNLLTGPPHQVNEILDRLGFSRKRDPKTGIIDHNNLFLLVDRQGRIAYRFSLGKRQEKWLISAIRLLIKEK